MKKNNSLVKAGGFYFVGNIFDKAVAFITVPIFTRMLSTEEYGINTTYLSWVSILSVILTLCLGNSIRTAVVDYENDKDGYMSSILCLGTISSCIISSIVIVTCYFFFQKRAPLQLVVLCCMQSYGTSIIQAIQWRYMMDVKYLKRTLLQSIPNLIIIFLSILLISNMKTDKHLGRIYSYTIVTFGLGLIYLGVYIYKGKKIINIPYWKYALSFSLPLIFHGLSQVILSQADRTMITLLYNASETGIYGLAYQFGMVPLVFSTTFENIWVPWFTERMKLNDKSSITQMVKPYSIIMSILCSGLMLVAPEFLMIMSTKEYYSGVFLVGPVMAGIFTTFLISISLNLEYYKKQTRYIAINTLIAAVINIVLNYLFIPKYGATAAAYTTVVSYAISFILHYNIAQRQEPGLFPFKTYILPIILVLFCMIATSLLMEMYYIRWIMGVILGICFIIKAKTFLKMKSHFDTAVENE